jgi:hypothetical protein
VGHDGVWRGTAEPSDEEPGLLGDAPAIELTGGILTFQRRVGPAARSVRQAAGRIEIGKARFQVGKAPETVLQNGDLMYFERGPMAELSLVLTREESLIMALGTVSRPMKQAGVATEIDPRADDLRFGYMRSLLDKPHTQLVWVDPQAADYERQLAELDRIPPHVTMVSIAVRCDDFHTSAAVNRRALQDQSRPRQWSFNYEEVPTRFRTREEFIAHLRGLPERRPKDFFIRFAIEGTVADVREGECRVHAPWMFSVCSVFSPNYAWSLSHVGVARTHPSLTPECLHTSVGLIQQNTPKLEP